MIYYQVESQDTDFPVCQMTVNGITRYGRLSGMAHYYKTTSCCRKLNAVRHKCVIMFLSKIDSTYKFDMSTYEGDQKIKLLCIKYNITFFQCNKRHSSLGHVNVLLCETCETM